GDIYLVSLRKGVHEMAWRILGFGGSESPGNLRRLTGAESLDAQPCWHPSGNIIFYASASSFEEPYEIFSLKPGKKPRKLTRRGGQMPACSPDGSYLVFVSRRNGKWPALYVMRLKDRNVVRLTGASGIDLAPVWGPEGKKIFFVRHLFDTNKDGRLDTEDHGSIFSVSFRKDIFSNNRRAPVRQLTSWQWHDRAPRVVEGGIMFARRKMRAAGGKYRANLWALPACGEIPRMQTVDAHFAFARKVSAEGRVPNWREALAWQNALWAARESRQNGDFIQDTGLPSEAAEAALQYAEALAERNHMERAIAILEEVPEEFPESPFYLKMARIKKLSLQRQIFAGTPNREEMVRLHREALKILKELRADGESDNVESLTCRAQLELGLVLQAMKKHADALRELRAVPRRFPQQKELCARSLLAIAEIFENLGRGEGARTEYLRILRMYSETEPYANRAASRLVDRLAKEPMGKTVQQKVNELREILEQYAHEPVLPALAQNRIGDLYYDIKDYHRARQAYRQTIEQYPAAGRQTAAAYLSLATTQLDQRDYRSALNTYKQLQQKLGVQFGKDIYQRARKGYVRTILMKAREELNAKDPKLALSTYSRLVEFDSSIPAAHRGIVDCEARLGQTDQSIIRYRKRVEKNPRDHVAHFALARAYSYYGPQGWGGSGAVRRKRVAVDRKALRLLKQAILMDFEEPYYHQLRGFLFNRLALITGNSKDEIKALDSYLTALAMSSPQEDPDNYASLLFNVGDGYMLVGQPENAYEFYKRALDAGFEFRGEKGLAALEKISRSATDSADFDLAVRLLKEALQRTKISSGAEQEEITQVMVRKVRILDQLGFVEYLDGDYASAADYYKLSISILRKLMTLDPKRKAAYYRNLVLAERNTAVNIFRAVQSGNVATAELKSAYNLLKEAVDSVARVGVARGEEEKAPGLFTIDIEIEVGESRGASRFDLATEKRLLFTYMGRIASHAGKYNEAERYFSRKLHLYPSVDPEERPDVFVERAIVWTQIGELRISARKWAEAAEAYKKAAEMEAKAGNLRGEMDACFSLGQLYLQAASGKYDKPADLKLRNLIDYHRELLAKARKDEDEDLIEQMVRLNTTLARLSQKIPDTESGGDRHESK
ncbi:MAG: tetratricopeptide repeat protein, partial [Candidatus Brocadiia bacterium]